jgi:hypothetical protein
MFLFTEPIHDGSDSPLQRVCAKVFQTKRKVFDSKAQAVPDEAKALQSKPTKKPGPQRAAAAAIERPIHAEEPGKTKWEAKSGQLRDAMRAARQYNLAKAAGKSGADLPPPVSSAPDPSLVQCPNCGRSFNETAADRHIPKCSSIKARVSSDGRLSSLASKCSIPIIWLAANCIAQRVRPSCRCSRCEYNEWEAAFWCASSIWAVCEAH